MTGSERSPHPTVAEDLEDLDPGLARERTWLAWRRTAISLTAVGIAVLKISPIESAPLLVMTLGVWAVGRGHVAAGPRMRTANARRPAVRLTALTVLLTALTAVFVAVSNG
jgi:uncharacterized membrane protein YidH (DUF202 family)